MSGPTTRAGFVALFPTAELAVAFEKRILEAKAHMPRLILDVLDDAGAEPPAYYWQFLARQAEEHGETISPANTPFVLLDRSQPSAPGGRLLLFPRQGPGSSFAPGTIVAIHANGLRSVFAPPLWIDDVARMYSSNPARLIRQIIRTLTDRLISTYIECPLYPALEAPLRGGSWINHAAAELLDGFELIPDEETHDELALWLSIGVRHPWGEWRRRALTTSVLEHQDGRLAVIADSPRGDSVSIAIASPATDRGGAR